MTAADLRVVVKVVACILLARAGAENELRGRDIQGFLHEVAVPLPTWSDRLPQRGIGKRPKSVGLSLPSFSRAQRV